MLHSRVIEEFLEDDAHDVPENLSSVPATRPASGNVIVWPKNKRTDDSAPAPQRQGELEVRKGMELLQKLSHPHGSDQMVSETDFSPLDFSRSIRHGGALQEEMPRAIAAYRQAWFQLRKSLPQLIATRRLDLSSLKAVVGDILASLERNRDALFCLTKLVSSKGYAYTHSVNVCIYLGAYALNSGMSRDEALTAGMAGLLHDIGMAMLPHSLLRASGALSPTEKVLVRRHPILAHEILQETPGVCAEILCASLEHHERYDGSGYPMGTSGDAISFMGHLSAIASAFDAISSDREFKRSLQPHYALGEMFKLRNRQFHPELLDTFIRMIGIFPVGTIVRLEDGYLGIVSAISPDNLTRPVITLVRDPNGYPMMHLECDMSREKIAGIASCLSPSEVDVPVHEILGIRL